MKKQVIKINMPYKWYSSATQVMRYYISKGVKYIVK